MSTFNAGNAAVDDVKFGNTTASQVYQGNTKVWPSAPAAPDYTGIVAAFNTTTLPTGWVLCDGTNGTLDLRDKFVVGSGATYTLGAVGGANTVVADLPLHSHNASDNGAGSHNHNSVSLVGNHTHTTTVSTAGHQHNYASTGNTTVFANQFANYLPVVGTTSTNTNTSATEAAHAESSSSSSSHTHAATSNSGAHSHFASSNNAGSSTAHENRPPYYALVYAQATATATGATSLGMIAMTESATPTGWLTLNATNLPDLRDRFVVGSQLTYALGAVGGSNTVALALANLPLHAHNVSVGTENLGHQHNTNSSSHSHGVNLSAHAAHTHTYSQQNSSTQTIGGTGSTIRATPGTASTVTAVSASHSVTWANQSETHAHGSLESTGGHSHTISGGTTGSSGAHENRPPYRATTFIRKNDTADIPAGVIVMFNGTTIPTGWTEATNYRDRFPVGAGLTYTVGAVGGANTVTIDANTMAGHNHNAGTNFDGDHPHTSGNNNVASHSHSGAADHTGSHSHSITVSGTTTTKLAGSYLALMSTSVTALTVAANHTHTASASNNNSLHSHSYIAAGSHSHSASMGNASSGTSHENRPPFTALTFIIKT